MGKLDKTKLYEPKKSKHENLENQVTGSALPKACVNCAFYNAQKVLFGKRFCSYYNTHCAKLTSKGCDHFIPYQ